MTKISFYQNSLLVLYLITFSFSSQLNTYQQLRDGCSYFYSQINFEGDYYTLCNTDTPSQSQTALLTSRYMKSIHVTLDCVVEIYTESFYGQSTLIDTLRANKYSNLAYNNYSYRIRIIYNPPPINSSRTNPLCFELFERCNFRGYPSLSFCLDPNRPRSNGWINPNYSYCSMRVGSQVKVVLYTEPDMKGNFSGYNPGSDNGYLKNQIDKISSYYFEINMSSDSAVPDEGCVYVYQVCNFGGSKQTFCMNNNPNIFSMNIASIKLGKNTKLSLKNQNLNGWDINSYQNCIPFDNNIMIRATYSSYQQFQFIIDLIEKPDTSVAPEGCTYIYEKCNYMGTRQILCDWSREISRSFFGNAVSSIKVPDNHSVRLYEYKNFEGKSNVIYRDTECLQTNSLYYNTIFIPQSIQVVQKRDPPKSNCINFYSRCYYNGSKTEICAGSSFSINLRPLSIELSDNTEATIYSLANYTGESISINKNVECYDYDNNLKNWKNKMSSLKVANVIDITPVSDNCVFLYEKCGYKGRRIERCGTDFNLRLVFGNDYNVFSIRLGKNVQIILYNASEYSGHSELFSANIECLEKNPYYNKSVESLKVINNNGVDRKSGCIQIFDQCLFKGNSLVLCLDTENIRNINPAFNVHSYYIGPNTEVSFFSGFKFAGDSYKDSSSNYCVKDVDYSKRLFAYINSIKLRKKINFNKLC